MPDFDLTQATFFRDGVELGQLQRIVLGGADIWVRPSIPEAVSAATSPIMFLPNSRTSNRHDGRAWENGSSSAPYAWPSDFRPEWTGGANNGYFNQPFIAGIGSDNTGSRTKARWDQPDTFWDADVDPRRDLAGKEVLVVNQGDLGGIAAPYQWSSSVIQDQLVEDEAHTLLFVEQFVTQSTVAKAVLIEADPPHLPGSSIYSDDTVWRAAIDRVELAAHYHRDRIRAWLDDNGHSDIEVKVVPYHRVAAQVYDDAVAGGIIPGDPFSHRAFYAGWGEGEGNTTHVYMKNRTGQMPEALLWSYVAFGRMPDTTGDYTDRDVSPALAAYFTSVVQDVAEAYAPAGLGGTDEGTIGATVYNGETEADIFGAAIVSKTDVPLDAKWADLTRTTPAVEGGPVAAIGDFEAVSGGAVPILTGDTLTFTRQPIRHTLAGPRGKAYAMLIVDLEQTAPSRFLDGSWEMWSDYGQTFFGFYSAQGGVLTALGDLPMDQGHRVAVEFLSDGSTATVRVLDLERVSSQFVRVNRSGQSGMGSATEIIHNSTAYSDAHDEQLRYSLFLDRLPTDSERSLLYSLLTDKLGLQVW